MMHLESLSLLPLGDKAMVMDRSNGKWAMVAAEAIPLVRLLPFARKRSPRTFGRPGPSFFRALRPRASAAGRRRPASL